jgi:hypothetical protein
MRDWQSYDMGERGYVTELAREAGLPVNPAPACPHHGCETPIQQGACAFERCPRKGGHHG